MPTTTAFAVILAATALAILLGLVIDDVLAERRERKSRRDAFSKKEC